MHGDTTDSPIVAFYRGTATDNLGRSLAALQAQELDDLENVHDFVQWLFPLPEPSLVNDEAPLLTPRDIDRFRGDPSLRARLLDSLRAMFGLYGLDLAGTETEPEVVRSADFAARAWGWIDPCNHNYLRLTRILRSLTLLGCAAHARALLRCLEGVYAERGDGIGTTTLGYWRDAVSAAPAGS